MWRRSAQDDMSLLNLLKAPSANASCGGIGAYPNEDSCLVIRKNEDPVLYPPHIHPSADTISDQRHEACLMVFELSRWRHILPTINGLEDQLDWHSRSSLTPTQGLGASAAGGVGAFR